MRKRVRKRLKTQALNRIVTCARVCKCLKTWGFVLRDWLEFVLISCSCDTLCAAELRLRIQIKERGAIGTAGQPRQLKADLSLLRITGTILPWAVYFVNSYFVGYCSNGGRGGRRKCLRLRKIRAFDFEGAGTR